MSNAKEFLAQVERMRQEMLKAGLDAAIVAAFDRSVAARVQHATQAVRSEERISAFLEANRDALDAMRHVLTTEAEAHDGASLRLVVTSTRVDVIADEEPRKTRARASGNGTRAPRARGYTVNGVAYSTAREAVEALAVPESEYIYSDSGRTRVHYARTLEVFCSKRNLQLTKS